MESLRRSLRSRAVLAVEACEIGSPPETLSIRFRVQGAPLELTFEGPIEPEDQACLSEQLQERLGQGIGLGATYDALIELR
jgi:hypothetical protein